MSAATHAAAFAALAAAGAAALSMRGAEIPRTGLSTRLGWLLVPTGAAVLLLPPRLLVLAGIAAGVLGGVRVLWRQRRDAQAAQGRREKVLEACDALAAELGAGSPPVHALAEAFEGWPEAAPVVVAARLHADVPAAMRSTGELPGATGLRAVAAAWQVAHHTGSGLGAAVAVVADGIREDQQVNRLISSELAAAHATAVLMAGLPLVVIALAAGIGAAPVAFLTGGPLGLACLVAGVALLLTGWWWLHRLAAGVLGR